MDLTTRVSLVQSLLTTKELSVSVGARLLDINRTSIYYKSNPASEEELACKEIIDHLHTDNPSWGARQMSAQLKSRGYRIGRRKARRYMTMPGGEFDWGGRLRKGIGGAQRFPQNGRKPFEECKGRRELDCDTDGWSRYESRA